MKGYKYKMSRIFKISLILATFGREEQIKSFFDSLIIQTYSLLNIQVILVDQNDRLDLSPIVNQYKDKLWIEHIKTTRKGLSYNRNIGLNYAKGEIIAFPDDDCEYLVDTIAEIEKAFEEFNNCDLVLGKIVDKSLNDSMKSWPKTVQMVNRYNFIRKCSSITMFFRNNSDYILEFNEKLGSGEQFGSCEDADIIYRYLKNDKGAIYTPNIKVYHPHSLLFHLDSRKTYSYGLGFGAFCRINGDLYTYFLLIGSIAFHFIYLVYSLVTFNFHMAKKRFLTIISRIQGFFLLSQ